MGKVTVGTGPCFFLNEFSALIPVQQTFGFPPRPMSPAAVSHPLPHCSPVSSPGLFPPRLWCLRSLSRCPLEGAFFRTWLESRWHSKFPRSPALPPALLLAHRSEQEVGAQVHLESSLPIWALLGFYCLEWGIEPGTMCFSCLWSLSLLNLSYVRS